LRGIEEDSPASLLLLRGKAMSNCIADLIVYIPSLEANLLARKIGIKEEGLNS
jgi:hypothetical protein